ncbi:MAG: rhomboid family intramembrane serine protease [Rhodospirillales bacterium]|nr:MAG: rhomboid family intramembrane serine protease [Rhodospirillales bacterium]
MFLPLKDSNPLKVIPYQLVTLTIIVLCGGTFVWQLLLPDPAAETVALSFGAIPAVLFDHAQLPPELALIPAEATVLTSMFLHAGWLHIGGNMLYLWVFGDNIEDSMGHVRFAIFYLLCGVAAVLAHAVIYPQSVDPLIGASGAISGVLGAYLLLHPKVRVVALVMFKFPLPLPLPAYVVLGSWIVLQFVNVYTDGAVPSRGGTAWWAHIGGFVAGMLLIVPMRRKHVKLFDRERY